MNRLLRKDVYPGTGSKGRTPNETLPGEQRAQVLTLAVEGTAIDEAEYIARTIKKESGRAGRRFSDFAILCREVGSVGRPIQDALKKYTIPFSCDLDVSRDPMVRFVLRLLQVLAVPHEDEIVLKWLSSSIARLDRADLYRAFRHARKTKQEFLMTVADNVRLEAGSEGCSLFHKSCDRLKELLSLLDFVREGLRSGKRIWELVNSILARSGAIVEELPQPVAYLADMIRDIESVYEKRPGLAVVLSDIRGGLTQFLAPDEPFCEESDAVRIMPIWQARGLEFPFVFVPGLVSNLFPGRHPTRQVVYGEDVSRAGAGLSEIDLSRSMSLGRRQEQERQLFYIAMTRAKEKLYLTFARQYPGKGGCEPSPFLADLLGGSEVSSNNCAEHGILYHEHTVSGPSGALPALDDVVSRAELEIACSRYVAELDRLDHQKAGEAAELLASTGVVNDLLPHAPLEDVVIRQSPSRPLSSTSIRSFLSCPRRYFLRDLLSVKVDILPGGAQFGRFVHEVLETFHSRFPKLCDHSLEQLCKHMREMLIDAWAGNAESEAAGPASYDAEFAHNLLQARSYLELAGEVLLAYLKAEHGRWDEDRSCIRTEAWFEFLAFGKYTIVGCIDRIDTCESTGDEIIDFKTSAYDTEAESALKSKFLNTDDDPDYRPLDYQLPIYCLAGLGSPDLSPGKLVIYQLRNFSRRTGEPFRRELEILRDEDTRSGRKDKFLTAADVESVKGGIVRALDGMVSGVYPPDPREDSVCERECEFCFVCDRGSEDLGEE